MDFVQGKFIVDGKEISVIGNESGYKYKWLNPNENTNLKTSKKFIIGDLSWSMYQSKSAQPTIDSIKEVCKFFFEMNNLEVNIVLFGKTSYLFSVDINDYENKFNEIMNSYFEDSNLFNKIGKFDPQATIPETAFEKILEELKNNLNSDMVQIIFMTDGQFNGTNKNLYKNIWDEIGSKFYSIGKELMINVIGYQNDDLNNIKDMKLGFDKYFKDNFLYTTIDSSDKIKNTMMGIANNLDNYQIPKIELGKNVIRSNETFYSKEKLFDNLELIDILSTNLKDKSIDIIWIKKVIMFEVELALKEKEIVDNIRLISMSGKTKEYYKKIIVDLVPYYQKAQNEYLFLNKQYKSLKSRNIPCWQSLVENLTNFTKLLREIQEFISDELNEKKTFELSTKISNSISSRHLRTLQRRRICNDKNKIEQELNIEFKSTDPISIFITKNNEILEKNSTSSLNDLNDYYNCFYSHDNWQDCLNNLFGILFQYKWKEMDDWAPSRAYIEIVNSSSFLTLNSYKEMQDIFGGGLLENMEHTKLYGNNKYIKSTHDGVNAFIPIASDPFFMKKTSIVKERIGYMIIGSNLGFTNKHILLYVAVLKQCFNQLLSENTSKLRQITLLLLNTFKLLTDKINCIYDGQIPLTKPDILYYIAKGNTSSSYFCSAWESAIFCLISNESHYSKALNKFNQETGNILEINEFKKLVWEMVYRHFLIDKFVIKENWNDPTIWELMDQEKVEEELKIHGIEYLEELLMNENKLKIFQEKNKFPFENLPEKIREEIIASKKIKKIFNILTNYADKLNDKVWEKLSESLIPFELDSNNNIITDHFNNNNLMEFYQFWTNLECLVFGQKNCYPKKDIEVISKCFVNIVNDKFGSILNNKLSEIKELMEFKKKYYETRYLPITFNEIQKNEINALFENTFINKISEDEFQNLLFNILEKDAIDQINEALEKDKITIIKNLHNYCLTNNHFLKIKSTKLPESCPSNATSPYFLQKLSDIEFSAYFKPLGFGWSTKKYRSWVDDFHPKMIEYISCNNEEFFVQTILDLVKNYKCQEERDIKYFENYIRIFYNKFKNEKSDQDYYTLNNKKNYNYYFK